MSHAARIVVFAVAAFAAGTIQAGDLAKGKASYEVCAACHGAAGEGNQDLNAPALAGLPASYLIRQLENFKSGARGADAKDEYGTQMRPMAMTLPDGDAINNVVAHIGTFAAIKPAATLEGDADKGKAGYATCAACHGPAGEGVEALNAPPLTGQYDWYLVRQLNSYKNGLRGTHEKDTFGQQMRPMAMILATEAAVHDVVAYIMSLN